MKCCQIISSLLGEGCGGNEIKEKERWMNGWTDEWKMEHVERKENKCRVKVSVVEATPWSNWWRHWPQRRRWAVVKMPGPTDAAAAAAEWSSSSSWSAFVFCSFWTMDVRLRIICCRPKRRPSRRMSTRQNYTEFTRKIHFYQVHRLLI